MKNTRKSILLALAAALLTPLSVFAGSEEKQVEPAKSECPDCKKNDGKCTKCDEASKDTKSKCPDCEKAGGKCPKCDDKAKDAEAPKKIVPRPPGTPDHPHHGVVPHAGAIRGGHGFLHGFPGGSPLAPEAMRKQMELQHMIAALGHLRAAGQARLASALEGEITKHAQEVRGHMERQQAQMRAKAEEHLKAARETGGEDQGKRAEAAKAGKEMMEAHMKARAEAAAKAHAEARGKAEGKLRELRRDLEEPRKKLEHLKEELENHRPHAREGKPEVKKEEKEKAEKKDKKSEKAEKAEKKDGKSEKAEKKDEKHEGKGGDKDNHDNDKDHDDEHKDGEKDHDHENKGDRKTSLERVLVRI